MNRLRSALSVVVVLAAGQAPAATASDLAAVVSPTRLMSAYTCATYAEAALATPLTLRLQQQPSGAPFTAAAMKNLLTQFDAIVADFCAAVDLAFAAHPSDVKERFAKAYQLTPDPDLSSLPGDARAVQWFDDNNHFLAQALPLAALHGIVNTLAPELLGPALRVPHALVFSRVDDPKLQEELDRISTGDEQFIERRLIQLLVVDPAFARIAPPRFDLARLARAESATRARGANVLASGRNPWVSLKSFGTAMARTRRHFGGFDLAQAYGFEPACARAVQRLGLLQR